MVDFDRFQMLKNVRRHFIGQFDQRMEILNVDMGNIVLIDPRLFNQHFLELFHCNLMLAPNIKPIAHHFQMLGNRLLPQGLSPLGLERITGLIRKACRGLQQKQQGSGAIQKIDSAAGFAEPLQMGALSFEIFESDNLL